MRGVIAIAVALLAGCAFDTSGLGSNPDPPDAGATGGAPDAEVSSPDARSDLSPDAMAPPEEPDAGVCRPHEASCREHGDRVCVDLDTDDRNCGACGNRCGGGKTCIDGYCEQADD